MGAYAFHVVGVYFRQLPHMKARLRPAALLLVAAVASGCRLVALGDVHGDIGNARRALHATGIVDGDGHWAGGCATLVQTGDVVDRGLESLGALRYFARLQQEARVAGGEVVLLLGNHEMMNLAGDVRFVNPDEMKAVGGEDAWKALFAPGGEFRELLKDRPILVIRNDTVFVHAGLLPDWAAMGPAALNKLATEHIAHGRWNEGVLSDDGPTWTRKIVLHGHKGQCAELDAALTLMGASRMVVGHTVQMNKQINVLCSGRLVCIDTGMSTLMMNVPSALEVIDELSVRPIYPKPE